MVFHFACKHIMDVMLLENNPEGYEYPILFFRKALRDNELKYNILEKQAFSLVWSLKGFQEYVLHSKISAYVPHPTVRDILM